jgi:glycosyltransferase involved in cell wall biosynthesis
MSRALELLFVSSFPAGPPTFGAQRRIDGLMRSLAPRHRLSFVGLVPPYLDPDAARRWMEAYCERVVLVPCPEAGGWRKRLTQLRSLVSLESYERKYMNRPGLMEAIRLVLSSRRFDAVSVETPFLVSAGLRQAPAGTRPPLLLVDAHNVEFDLARQYGARSPGVLRKLHHEVNWRKLRREEVSAWQAADGVAFTSPDDAARARALWPAIRSAVIPNGVDVDGFRPRADLPTPDGRTVLFFGTMNYFPNVDAIRWLLAEIWPEILKRRPDARLKIIGSHPLPDVLSRRGPAIDVLGLVDDLRPHLASAGVVVVPLRVGGGTRLKILESLAMGKAIVSTTLGAEGIAARSGEHLLLADDPGGFADAVAGVLEDGSLARRLGAAGRRLVEGSYSWRAIGAGLESFLASLRDEASEENHFLRVEGAACAAG